MKMKLSSCDEMIPTFPLKCEFCEATHDGDVNVAIDDGWNFAVFDTTSEGLVQMAGCPAHRDEILKKMHDFVLIKTSKSR